MLENEFHKLEEKKEIRTTISQIRKEIKKQDSKKAFLELLQGKESMIVAFLSDEDAKTRKNTALLIGDLKLEQAKDALDAFMKEHDKEPRLILVQGVGAFIMEDDKAKAAKAQLLVKDAIKLAVYAESFGGALQMTDDITYFITHWEAEAYRSKK